MPLREKRGSQHALNPEAYHWVHATLVKGAVDAHGLFGPGLSGKEKAEYYRDMKGVGRVWGLKEHHLPADWTAFEAYYEEMVDERLEMNRSVRDVLEELARPQKPPVRWLPSPLWRPFAAVAAHFVHLVTVGGLPTPLRERFGLTWTERQERALRRFARLTRVLMTLVPPPLRITGSMFIAYWATNGPGSDPSTRTRLGAS